MTGNADAVVVGAGVVGASIAYHLAAAGGRVVLYERGVIGRSGATASSAGQVRMYHADPDDADLAVRSLPTFLHWADVVGGDCGFRQVGFAQLAAEWDGTAATVAALVAAGVDARMLSPRQFTEEHPGLLLDGISAVAYEPASGYADPVRTVRSLVAGAVRHGAVVRDGEPVVSLLRSGEAVTGVRATRSRASAPVVVLCTGLPPGDLLAALPQGGLPTNLPPGGLPQGGLLADLPATRHRRVGWCVAGAGAVDGRGNLPMIIDETLGTYFRPHGADQLLFRALLDGGDGAEPADDVDARVVDRSVRLVARRLPGVLTAPVLTTRSAAEAYTPDGRPLIGPVPAVPGLYLAAGFSGGGFKMAPAVGQAVTAELLDRKVPEELARYRPSRFAPRDTVAA